MVNEDHRAHLDLQETLDSQVQPVVREYEAPMVFLDQMATLGKMETLDNQEIQDQEEIREQTDSPEDQVFNETGYLIRSSPGC